MQQISYKFLLGGHDLEMLEIRAILDAHDLKHFDNNLRWGARLSSYKDVLNDSDQFVGIELIEDIPVPEHYTIIDHHNERSGERSSIEQLAQLIGIELNDYQKLVAANDRGYIPEMKALGASSEEIEMIRKADRKAQGVTEKDESLAAMSVSKNLHLDDDIIIVESLTPRFSAITDRLFPYEKLLISFNNNFLYLGKGVKEISILLNQFISQNKMFHGGGDNGFIGSADGALTPSETDSIKTMVINLAKQL